MTLPIRDVDRAFTWTQATLGFAKGLTKIPLAHYSSVPSAYLARTNGLNHMVITKLDKVVQDPIQFEKAMEILKDMTKLIWKLSKELSK